MRPTPSTRARAATHAAAFIPHGRWQLAEACGVCGRGFGVLRGRHHCRHCGMSVCSRHSRNREVVPSSLSPLRQRVCDQCFPACQRGVTRPRRRTAGARTFSVRFDDEDDGAAAGKKAPADSVSATTTTTATTMCTSTTISTGEPVTPLYSPKRPQRAPRSPRENLAMTLRAEAAATAAAERTSATANGPSGRLRQRQRQQQQQQQALNQQTSLPPPQPQRRRASTSDSRPQAQRRFADSAVSGSSSSCSFSSLDDHSSSSDDDGASSSSSDDDGDDEELIAKYLRRGAPLRSLGSTVTTRAAASGSILGRHDSPPLEAIEEKKSLDSWGSSDDVDDVDDVDDDVVLPPRKPSTRRMLAKHRKVSSASTISATSEEEEEAEAEDDDEREAERDGATRSECDSECDDEQQDDGDGDSDDGQVIVGEPVTPPARLDLQAVALAYSAAVKAAAERKRLPGRAAKQQQQQQAASPASVSTLPQTTPSPPPYQITEPERRVMQEIAALELEIQKHQSELPALLERLQQTERTAARLRAEARESQLRVQQYRKAQSVVARAVRSAKVLMREREFQAAILELLRAAGIDRASAAVWHLLAECRLEVSQLDAAEHACRKSLRLRQRQAAPRDVRPSVALLGRILHAQGRQDEAIECYLTALER